MKKVPGKNGGTILRAEKGETANPNGRPKKIYTILKQHGYSKDDMVTAFGELAWSSIPELNKYASDDTKPAIVRIVAKQLYLALKNGDWYKIKEIIEHTIGKPEQTSKITGNIVSTNQDVDVDKLPADLKKQILETMRSNKGADK